MLIEPFSSGSTILHTMDPRCKLIAAVIFSISTALLHSLPAALAALAVGFLLLFSCRLPAKVLCKRMIFMNLFVVFLWFFLPFSVAGESLWTWGPLTLTAEGLTLATLITIKSNAILTAFIALMATSSITALGQALSALNVPQKLSLLLLFTWRYVHIIMQEYLTLHTAAKMRGFVAGTNLRTYKVYANLTAMVLIKSYDRAERISRAMRLRGFTGSFHALPTSPVHKKDILIAVFLSFIVFCITALDASAFTSTLLDGYLL